MAKVDAIRLMTKAITEFVAVSKAQTARIDALEAKVREISSLLGAGDIDMSEVNRRLEALKTLQNTNDKAAQAVEAPGKVQ